MRVAEVAPLYEDIPLAQRRERWTDDCLPVLAHELDDLIHRRNWFVRRRQAERARRRGHPAKEPLDTSGTEEEKQPGVIRIDMERVADVTRRVDERSSCAFHDFVTVL